MKRVKARVKIKKRLREPRLWLAGNSLWLLLLMFWIPSKLVCDVSQRQVFSPKSLSQDFWSEWMVNKRVELSNKSPIERAQSPLFDWSFRGNCDSTQTCLPAIPMLRNPCLRPISRSEIATIGNHHPLS
jgi:hypothetical protein